MRRNRKACRNMYLVYLPQPESEAALRRPPPHPRPPRCPPGRGSACTRTGGCPGRCGDRARPSSPPPPVAESEVITPPSVRPLLVTFLSSWVFGSDVAAAASFAQVECLAAVLPPRSTVRSALLCSDQLRASCYC